jgi:hypothetical protein
MRCDCCDKILSDKEATARFVDDDGTATRYVNMCTRCQGFLPSETRIITRPDLDNTVEEDYDAPYTDGDIFLEGEEYGYED